MQKACLYLSAAARLDFITSPRFTGPICSPSKTAGIDHGMCPWRAAWKSQILRKVVRR